mmetsp:Transcript_1653/g.5749  ORF Transcript_1653/g.5749 Transcript_1653/m.5749 type:complete len:1123 (-) Transcript_1653:239-3607(-)|eukprot:CAMPEP_0117446206 /NCGR_PEP_ID=MMETSP0759-20121206/6209_1 /TAXON_ID=63605 /ORGANISM="Percolomonas cosmopolitus, Strain WS" /LENGTH=1122 /DNA_ID=CAMNT_0005238441 /DNA_START=151 /DNA_END=3519 /DNA_ORIENTATION=+
MSQSDTSLVEEEFNTPPAPQESSIDTAKAATAHIPSEWRKINNSGFHCQIDQLSELIDTRDMKILQKMNAQEGLKQILKSSDAGLAKRDPKDHQARATAFGPNVLPEKKPKNIITLFFEAMNDTMLIILIIMAVISIVLGLAFPESHSAPGETQSTAEQVTNRLFGVIEGAAILAAVIIVSSVTAFNDYKKEQKFRNLNKQNNSYNVRVVRDGDKTAEVNVAELLVGDVVRLQGGDTIPADGILLSSEGLKVNESSMTGESDDISKKPDTDPFILSGCKVQEGQGAMIVIAVGQHSLYGRMMEKLQKPAESTPLEEKLDDLAALIGKIGVLFATITFVVLLIGFVIKKVVETTAGKDVWTLSALSEVVSFVVIAVTVVVVAVPEGLPLAVTISLAYSVRKMMKDNNLVRHLAACETMGGADNICSDKTGTLTLNEMRVVKGWFAGTFYNNVEDENDALTEERLPRLKDTDESLAEILVDSIAVNTNADLIKPTKANDDDAKKGFFARLFGGKKKAEAQTNTNDDAEEVTGNKTEGALLLLVNDVLGYKRREDKRKLKLITVANEDGTETTIEQLKVGYSYVREVEYEEAGLKVRQWPFNSSKKRMSTLVKTRKGQNLRLYTKGASEKILEICTHFINDAGERVQFEEDSDSVLSTENEMKTKRYFLKNVIEKMASKGYRTLCLGYRNMDEGEISMDTPSSEWVAADYEHDLTLYCIVGIKDPIRPQVPKAVRQCQHAGIFVRMVTGDNDKTAAHIARDCGIKTEDGIVVLGPNFNKMSDHAITELLPRLQVMARSSPEDKFKLVTHLKTLNHVVAVTGDGTNDAPALKAADVGLSMGIAGTRVAKEASDIVILDDNFNSIVKAVLWGRSIFENIRKFLQFQVTVNVVALVLTVITAITAFIVPSTSDDGGNRSPPLTAVQLLWVNLIMDTFAALALATEDPEPELLERKPVGRSDSLITKNMWTAILSQAGLQLIISCFIYYAGPYVPLAFNETRISTMVFNAFVFCQLFNEFNARKINNEFNIFRNLHKSYIFIFVWITTFIVQIFVTQLGWKIVSTEGLNWYQWIITVLMGSLSIPVGMLRSVIARLILRAKSFLPSDLKTPSDPAPIELKEVEKHQLVE